MVEAKEKELSKGTRNCSCSDVVIEKGVASYCGGAQQITPQWVYFFGTDFFVLAVVVFASPSDFLSALLGFTEPYKSLYQPPPFN